MMHNTLTRFPSNFLTDFGNIQRQIDELFGARGARTSIRSVGRDAFPAINMGTTAETVEIFALVPGVNAAKLEVFVNKGLLTISGERENFVPKETEKLSVYAHERFGGAFRRVVSLPDDVDADCVDATYRDGVLRIVIPKKDVSKPRQIEVKSVN